MFRLTAIIFFGFFTALTAHGNECQPTCKVSQVKNFSTAEGVQCWDCVTNQEYLGLQKSCDEAIKKAREHRSSDSDFMKSCAANKSGSTAVACLKAAKSCQRCVGASQDDEDYDTHCADHDDDDLDDDSSDEFDGVNGVIREMMANRDGIQNQTNQRRVRAKDTDEAERYRNLFKTCPIYAVEEFDKIIELKEDKKEALQEAEEGIIEITSDLKQAMAELEEVQQKQVKLLPDYRKAVQKARKTSSDRLAQKFRENSDQIVELVFAKHTAEMQYAEAQRGIFAMCHQRAVEALDRYKADRADKIKRGVLRTKKGFASLTGLKDKFSRLSAYAKALRNNCLKKDALIVKQAKAARDVHNQNLTRIKLQMDKALARQKELSDQMVGAAQEPELAQELEDLQKTFEENNTRIGNAVKQAMLKVENLQNLLASAQEKKIEAEYLYEMYADQEKSAKNAGVSAGRDITADDFMSQAAGYIKDISSAYTYACNCDGEEGEAKATATKCASVKAMLDEATTAYDTGETSSGSQ